MGLKLNRTKKKHFLLSFLYRINKLVPLNSKRKLKLLLDLEWIFYRLASEESAKIFPYENHPSYLYSKKFLLKKITKDYAVLEIGCASGGISNYIANKAKKVIGIDYDDKRISQAKRLYKKSNLEFVNGEASKYLKNNNENFDVLILSHILEHLDNPKDFILKFKGFFKFIYIEIPDFDKTFLNQYRLKVSNELIYSDSDHVNEFDREEIKKLVADAGLKILNEEFRFGLQKFWCLVE